MAVVNRLVKRFIIRLIRRYINEIFSGRPEEKARYLALDSQVSMNWRQARAMVNPLLKEFWKNNRNELILMFREPTTLNEFLNVQDVINQVVGQ